ncbi:hypothetical protein LOC67_18220 [Stieleria sp. JC731]|uniref:hypothetical protein n=1 Tax=Pirellulaceae TaxID=2691357 RepID=UPI001E3B4D9D|nr:hypothetical protein [Stieleria sp. JC731]MCC9602491.1 hypothetical protein [Stieleria sp. JC731]
MRSTVREKLQKLVLAIAVATGAAPAAEAAGLGLLSGGCDSSECCDATGCDSGCGPLAACDAWGGCDSGCDAACLPSLGDGLLTQFIKPTDHCFDDFVSPMINFVHFEDPRTLTEIRPIFVNHWVPSTIGNNIPAGGSIQLLAMQFRVALTERLSLIGVKDGYIFDNTDGALDTLLDDGWASVTAGLKYNLLRDAQSGTLLSVGGTYEIPIGSQDALQDIGDGEFHLFATGGQRLLDGNAHWMSAFGWRTPADGNVQCESVHWSNHFDVKVTDTVYLLTELAWWHWTDSADNGAALGVAGQDLFNLSVSDVTGNDLVTQSVGLKCKPKCSTEYGIAYEFPLTEFKDVIEGRLQIEAIYRY